MFLNTFDFEISNSTHIFLVDTTDRKDKERDGSDKKTRKKTK